MDEAKRTVRKGISVRGWRRDEEACSAEKTGMVYSFMFKVGFERGGVGVVATITGNHSVEY